jgi:hypothetical protein
VGAEKGSGEHNGRLVDVLLDRLLTDDAIEPGGVDGVLLEGLCLEELRKVLDGVADLTTNIKLLERENERLAGSLARRSSGVSICTFVTVNQVN